MSKGGGIDYSKWDRMEFSETDDDEEEEQGQGPPRVTRLDRPSQVTLLSSSSGQQGGGGGIVVHPPNPVSSDATTTQSQLPSSSSSDHHHQASSTKTALSPSTIETKKEASDAAIPKTWTEKGGTSRMTTNSLGGQEEEEERVIYWSQERDAVVLRVAIPPSVQSLRQWSCRIEKILSYKDRTMAVATGDTPHLVVTYPNNNDNDSTIFLEADLPRWVHRAEEDDNDDQDEAAYGGWSIERWNDMPYFTLVLHKASPMNGVVLWWNRPFLQCPEIELAWRQTDATSAQQKNSSSFQEAWDEAHRLFQEKRKTSSSDPGPD